MPRDPRMYITLPLDFDEHDKVFLLSDSAFRTFVEMNLVSRRNHLDGRIRVAVARKKWKARALTELVNSHPERPLVLLEDDHYIIRDYAEHQLTEADIEATRQKKARAGALGGKARAGAQAGAKQPLKQNEAESESESEPEINNQDTHTSDPVSNRASDAQGPDEIESVEVLCVRQAATLGVDFGKVKSAVGKACGRFPDPTGVMRIIATVLDRAKPPIKSPTGLVLRSVENDWPQWQQMLDAA